LPMGPPPPGLYQRPENFMNQGVGPGPGYGPEYERRPMMPFAAPEGFPLSGAPVGADYQRFQQEHITSPHGLQKSQSFAQNEQENTSSSQSTSAAFYAVLNGTDRSNGFGKGFGNGHVEDFRFSQQAQARKESSTDSNSFYRSGPQHHTKQQLNTDNSEALVAFIRAQFCNMATSDCFLEIIFSHTHKVRLSFPGHSLILIRSPKLMRQITETSGQPGIKTFTVETEDPYILSEAVQVAVATLYGISILDFISLETRADLQTPTKEARFHLAIGYAAVGHLLEVPLFVCRGLCEYARI